MHAGNRINSTFKCIVLFFRTLGGNPLNCFNCELLQLKQFLQNQTFGDANAKCDGTNHMVVDFNFTDCTGSIVQTHDNLNKETVHHVLILNTKRVYIHQGKSLTKKMCFEHDMSQ